MRSDAKAERPYLPNKGKAFFELLPSEPDRLFRSDEIIAALPEHFAVAVGHRWVAERLRQTGEPERAAVPLLLVGGS